MSRRVIFYVASVAAAVLSGLGGPRAGAQDAAPNPGAEAPPVIDDGTAQAIVVTGRRYDPTKPKREAIDYFRDYCFESNRLKGQSTAPTGDPDWLPLDDGLRAKLNLGPSARAYELIDAARGYTLILKIEQLNDPDNIRENRCSIIVVGGRIQDSLLAQMSAVFRSGPVQGDIDARDGVKPAPGWRHWVWTAMPERGSQDWDEFRLPRKTASEWIIVVNPILFYSEYNYLLGDLKRSNLSSVPVSIMSFVFKSYVHPKNKQG